MRRHMLLRAPLLALLPLLLNCGEPLSRRAPETTAAARATPPAPATPPAEEEPRFDPSVVQLGEESPVLALREALETGRPAAAMLLLEEELPGASAEDRPRMLWLGAEIAARSERPLQSRAYLAELGELDHPLSPWARLREAEALLEDQPEQALSKLAPLLTEEWTGREDARRARALALAAQGRPEAVALLRSLLPRPEQAVAASVAMPLAELLAASEAQETREEALGLFRRVAYRQPATAEGRRAAEREAALLASFPPDRRGALEQPPVELAFARAQALAEAMQSRAAERAVIELLPRTAEDATLRCRARLLQGKVARNQRQQRARAAALLSSLAEECEEEDVRAWAHYYAGRSYTSEGRAPLAIQQFESLERETPGHRLADDARLRAALLHRGAGRLERAEELLRSLPDAYPQGDMAGEARFLLAWEARRAGRHAEALGVLEASLRDGPQEEEEDVRGRAAYWRARTLQDLDRVEDATQAYLELGRRHPLSYYAQQAHARLLELDAAQARALRESWSDRGSREGEAGGADRRLEFPISAPLRSPAFARAIALLQVGDQGRARRELLAAGVLGDQAPASMLWLAAALYERAGEPHRAVSLARRRLREFMDRAPAGRHRGLWRVAYPKAFAPLIEGAAEAESLPPALIYAIAREESSFRPNVVSWAEAYGLVQLIRPTARRFARPLGLPSDPVALRRPEINLRIGARYMAYLGARFDPNPALIPPAYNAGSGAVARWLRERGQLPLDAFIEEIPYDETRRYTRRVLQSYGIYRWLESGDLPPLPRTLPEAGEET